MNESDLLKVLQELKVYSRTWKSVSSRSISCQTDFDEVTNNNNIPFIFCSQFSPECDVETQCNIPLSSVQCKSCASAAAVEDVAIQCDLTLKHQDCSIPVKSEKRNYTRHIKREKEDDYISLSAPFFQEQQHELSQGNHPDLPLFPFKQERDVNNTKQDFFPESFKKENYTNQSKNSVKHKGPVCKGEVGNHGPEEEEFDIHLNDVSMEDESLDDEPFTKGKMQLTSSDKELFYSDDEKFWKEMTKRRKRIYMKIRRKLPKRRKNKPKEPLTRSNFLHIEKSGNVTHKESLLNVPGEEEKRANNVSLKEESAKTTPDSEVNESTCHLQIRTNEPIVGKNKIESEFRDTQDKHDELAKIEGDWITDNENAEENEPDLATAARKVENVRIPHNEVNENACLRLTKTNESIYGKSKVENKFGDMQDKHEEGAKIEAIWITDDENDEENEPDFAAALKDEFAKNREVNSFLCDICGKLYAKSHVLREHIVKRHSEHELAKAFSHRCVHCGRIYTGAKQLEVHQGQFKGPCEVCGMMYECSGLFWIHRRKHNAMCEVCNKSFANMPAYKFHMKSYHEKNRIECHFCGRGFLYPSQLNAHIEKKHSNSTGEAQTQKCNDCEFSTDSVKSLQIHKGRIHNNDRIYTCNICNETFNKLLSLKQHRKVHINVAITCKSPHTNFSSKDQLTEHSALAHSANDTEQPESISTIQISYPCFPCQQTFATADDLQTHIGSVHDSPESSHYIVEPSELIQEAIYISEGEEVVSSTDDLNVNPESTMSISLPATAVPPDVDLVEIDGIQYRVVRE